MTMPWFRRLRRFLSTGFDAQKTSRDTTPSFGTNFSVDGLNIEAARRQATLGKGYAKDSHTFKRLAELQQGIVTLSPHKSWTGDYTNWIADPFVDRNWRFQFQSLRWINPFLWDALAGSEQSRAEWKRIVRSWAEENTPPARAKDSYAWMDMTDGNRAIQISLGAPIIDPDDHWYVELLTVHRNWLLDDANIVPGNHGLHQNLGLFVVATVLNDDVGIQRSIERLGAQILEAFDEGGLNEEGSVGYHQMNLVWWQQAQKRLALENASLPKAALERLKCAGQTLGYLLLPDGTMPQIGDGNRGNGRQSLHPLVRQVVKGRIREPDLPTFHHYDNGFTVFRSAWGQERPLKQESHTIVRHGRDLLRHSHNDRGSVHLYSRGRRWITDGGFHSYQLQDPNRSYTKSRLAHSLVDLPNQEYDASGNVPVLYTEQTANLHSIEILDDNFESAVWKRRVVFVPEHNIWVIWDRITAQAPVHVQQQWLIDIGIKVDQPSSDAVVLNDKDQRMRMQWFGDTPTFDIVSGSTSAESKRGLIGVRWKTMESGTSLHATFHSEATDSIVVISHPSIQGQAIELIDRNRLTSFGLRIRNSGQEYSLKFEQDHTDFAAIQAG